MTDGARRVSPAGASGIVATLGALYVAMGAALAASRFAGGASASEAVGRFALIGIPGSVLLYGGLRLSKRDLRPDVYPRVVGWTVGGFAAMAAIVVAMETISPSGIDNPAFAAPLGTALGSVGGFGVGVHDAQAKSRERELEETIERLRASNERLEQFAYATSHDLQEPLRMVSSYLRLLESRYGDDLDDEALEYVDFAVDGADRMRAMVDSLLEYSRVTRGEPLEPTDAKRSSTTSARTSSCASKRPARGSPATTSRQWRQTANSSRSCSRACWTTPCATAAASDRRSA